MKNALILINEKSDSSPSPTSLTRELPEKAIRELSFIFMDEAVSEGYPVEKRYSVFLVNFKEGDKSDLSKRYNNFVNQITVSAKNYPTFLKNTVEKIGEFDNYIFVKSNIIPFTEEQIINLFERLKIHDIVFGGFEEDDFFLLGFINELKDDIFSIRDINEETVETLSLEKHYDVYYLPEKEVANSLESLTRLRYSLPDNSGLARKIDKLILDITKYRGDSIE